MQKFFGIEKDQVVVAGKQPNRIRARSVLAYWAIRDLALTATEVGKYLGLSKSAAQRRRLRGRVSETAGSHGFSYVEEINQTKYISAISAKNQK